VTDDDLPVSYDYDDMPVSYYYPSRPRWVAVLAGAVGVVLLAALALVVLALVFSALNPASTDIGHWWHLLWGGL
jgi:hypothetical protein